MNDPLIILILTCFLGIYVVVITMETMKADEQENEKLKAEIKDGLTELAKKHEHT